MHGTRAASNGLAGIDLTSSVAEQLCVFVWWGVPQLKTPASSSAALQSSANLVKDRYCVLYVVLSGLL